MENIDNPVANPNPVVINEEEEGEYDTSDRYSKLAFHFRHLLKNDFCNKYNYVIFCYIFRRVWAAHEDEAIKQLVAQYGTRSWSTISEHILSDFQIAERTGKQCRERWHNHLGQNFILFNKYIASDTLKLSS